MIFVTVGTTQYPFKRLIEWSIQQAKLFPQKKVIIQSGVYKTTQKLPKNVQLQQYYQFEEVQKFLSNAEIIICHAGMGTLIQSWSKGKKPYVVPRLEKYHEHANDHETEIAKYLSRKEKIFVLDISTQNVPKSLHKKATVVPSGTVAPKKLLRYLSSLC